MGDGRTKENGHVSRPCAQDRTVPGPPEFGQEVRKCTESISSVATPWRKTLYKV